MPTYILHNHNTYKVINLVKVYQISKVKRMGKIIFETNQEMDAFLFKRLTELVQERKLTIKDGRVGVVKYIVEESKNGRN